MTTEHFLEELKDRELGWGDLNWLKDRTSIKSHNELMDKILIPFRRELEPSIVRYGGKGKSYLVNKPVMTIWLEENFERVWR